MSIFNPFYERPSFDFSRIGSSPEPSNQPIQSFNENEEDMEAEALLEQFLADGVITDEERSILSELNLDQSAVKPKRPQPERSGQGAFDDFLSGLGDFLKNTDFQGARRQKRSTPSASPAIPEFIDSASDNSLSAGMTMNQEAIMNALPDQVQEATDTLPVGVQRGSPQANFIETLAESGGNLTDEQIAQFRREARDMGTTFNPETGFSRDPFLSAQASRTSTPLPGQTLSQFLRYEDSPEQRTEQFVDAQGRLRLRPTPEAAELQGLSDFVQPPLDEREMRLAQRDRLPGETQTQRDTRIARSRTAGAQAKVLSFDEARRRAEGELARRGVRGKDDGPPDVFQVNALARLIQDAEPERLEDREMKIADFMVRLNFEPKVVEREGQKFIQLSPTYFQPVRPEPKEDEPFVPRILENNGFIYFETEPDEFEIQPSTGQTKADIFALINEARVEEGKTPIEAPTSIETPTLIEGDQKDVTEEEYNKLRSGDPFFYKGKQYFKQ